MVGMWESVKMVDRLPRVRGDTLIISDHTAVLVRSFGPGRAGVCRSSWTDFSTGRHVKAPDFCPCSRLATLQGAPRTLKSRLGGSKPTNI